MKRFVCINCFDFVEECGHTDKPNFYSDIDFVKDEPKFTMEFKKPFLVKLPGEKDFHSNIGTAREDNEVSNERLEEIFSKQPDKSKLTVKEYKALMDNISLSLADEEWVY